MGTLLGSVAGLCVLAGLLAPDQDHACFRAVDAPPLHATARHVVVNPDELRVIELRELSDEEGLLVYGNARMRDSMVISSNMLGYLAVGDIVSDYEGSIER